MKKELELYYGAYKEFYQLQEVIGTYNSEKKTIKVKIEGYIVAYDDLDRVRKTIHKADELNKMLIPNILQKEEIEKKTGKLLDMDDDEFDDFYCRVNPISLRNDEEYVIYNPSSKNKKVFKNTKENFLYVPVKLIDDFVKLEQGKYKKIYANGGKNYSKRIFIEI